MSLAVAFIKKQPGLLEWNSYEFIKLGVVALIEEPYPMSIDLRKAENEGAGDNRDQSWTIEKRPDLLSKSQKKMKI